MAIDLAELLSRDGPKMGPKEQLLYLDIDRLHDDPRNFYALSGIDDLADNILTVGLQDPLRVREDPIEAGAYIIVSGHRRTAAMRKLVKQGFEEFRQVKCIVEPAGESEAMQELRLIWANKDTREMTSPEKARQAERVEAVLLQLREEGMEFRGRMRDHVAEICRTSKSKLSRLKVIKERLHKNLIVHWQDGRINDAVAYAIAQEDEEVQNALWSRYGSEPRTWTLEITERKLAELKRPQATAEKSSEPSTTLQVCSDYLAQRAEEDKWFFKNMRDHIFDRFIGGFTTIPTRKDGVDHLKDYCSNIGHWGAAHYESSKTGLEVYKNDRSAEKTKRSWTEVWDTMAVIALQKLAAEHNKPKPKDPEPVGQVVFNGWMPGGTTPSDPCDAVAVFDFEDGGKRYKQFCHWNGHMWKFSRKGAACEMQPVKWMALPPDEEDS